MGSADREIFMKKYTQLEIFSDVYYELQTLRLLASALTFFLNCHSKSQKVGVKRENEREKQRTFFIDSKEYESKKFYLNIIFQNEKKMKSNWIFKKIKR